MESQGPSRPEEDPGLCSMPAAFIPLWPICTYVEKKDFT